MEYTMQLTAIAGTLGLLWLTLAGLKRLRGNGEAQARLQVQQRVALANGCQLVVVTWDGQELLLATGNQPCTLVAARPARVEATAEATSAWAA